YSLFQVVRHCGTASHLTRSSTKPIDQPLRPPVWCNSCGLGVHPLWKVDLPSYPENLELAWLASNMS
ncbi:hypothetical protein JMJ77_0015187, partial [Colletotrichum scovillei]